MRRLAKTAAVFLLALLVMFGTVFSGAGGLFVKQVKAEEGEAYEYYVFIYSGKEGTFGGATSLKLGPYHYGDTCQINLASYGLVPIDGGEWDENQKYYPRGLKLAGHDNDEVSQRDYRSATLTVTEDMSFSVAYGMRGNMVRYVVNYVEEDANGNVVQVLHEPEEFYGMPGDKPVVSYQYVENYRPNAYNLGKTLSTDETENVFTFTYTNLTPAPAPQPTAAPAEEGGTTETETGGTAGTGTGGTAGTGTGGTAGTGTGGTAGTGTGGTAGTGTGGTAETGTPGTSGTPGTPGTAGTPETPGTSGTPGTQPQNDQPQEYIDLDDEETPLEDIKLDDEDENEQKPGEQQKENKTENGFDFMKILPFIIIAAAAVAFLIILFLILRARRRK